MTKLQKILLLVGLGAYIIPEFIWGITLGIFNFNNEFVGDSSNNPILLIILLVQITGLLILATLLVKRNNFLLRILGIVLFILSLWPIYAAYLILATLKM